MHATCWCAAENSIPQSASVICRASAHEKLLEALSDTRAAICEIGKWNEQRENERKRTSQFKAQRRAQQTNLLDQFVVLENLHQNVGEIGPLMGPPHFLKVKKERGLGPPVVHEVAAHPDK